MCVRRYTQAYSQSYAHTDTNETTTDFTGTDPSEATEKAYEEYHAMAVKELWVTDGNKEYPRAGMYFPLEFLRQRWEQRWLADGRAFFLNHDTMETQWGLSLDIYSRTVLSAVRPCRCCLIIPSLH